MTTFLIGAAVVVGALVALVGMAIAFVRWPQRTAVVCGILFAVAGVVLAPWATAIVLGVLVMMAVVVYKMAKNDVIFTIVQEGYIKIRLYLGQWAGELKPGLHLIGFPGIHSLYRRKMAFKKSVTGPDGVSKAEVHEDRDVVSYKTTRYPYALPFKDEEDKHALPLSGVITVSGTIVDYKKAFFETSDWYAEVDSKVLGAWRDLVTILAYDDDIVGRDKPLPMTVSQRLWDRLNFGSPSVLDDLRNNVGFLMESVQLVSIDPPTSWRDTTLAPYRAEKEKEAARHQAETSSILFNDTNKALQTWMKTHKNATPAQVAAKQDELRQRALAKTGGYQQVDIRGLEGAETAVVGGGGNAGVMVGGNNRGGKKDRKDKKGKGDDDEKEAMKEGFRDQEREDEP